MFDSVDTQYRAQTLVNSIKDKADESNWKFDAETLMITNNSHWKGIFPRDSDLRNTLTLYFGGFWKRFTIDGKVMHHYTILLLRHRISSEIVGITHPFEVPVFGQIRLWIPN